MNRVHLYLRRDPFRPRNFKGTIKPVVLVIKNQSSPVHFCLGRKKEIINLYCNPLSIAIIFFPRREGGWNGRVHVTFFSTHYMKRIIAVLSLVYRSAGSRKIGKWSTQHWKIFDLFFNKYSKSSCSHFLNYEVSMLSQRMRGWGRGVQVPLVTPLVNYDVKVFPT